MAIPVVPSWSLNDPITSAKLQQMCDAITWLLYKPHGTYGATGTAQTIANDTDVPIAWNVNIRQYKMIHSTVTDNSRVTPQEPGLYTIISTVQLTADADGYRKIWGRQNGSGTEGSVADSITGANLHSALWAGQLYFNGTSDYVEIMYRHTAGAGTDVGFGEFNPRLSVIHGSLLS